MSAKDRRVAVVGTGLMGLAIAACLALAGDEVDVFDVDENRRESVPALLEKIFAELIAAGSIGHTECSAAISRIRTLSDLTGLADSKIVFEAIVERLDAKRALYAELEAVLKPEAVIASNTSGLLPDMLSEGMQYPERFIIAHFWNPPHVIPFVELVPATVTTAEVCSAVHRRLTGAGFEAVLLKKAVPGFIGNRIQFAVLREALHLVQSGIADAPTVDAVVRSCIGRRYAFFGPFEAADLGGLRTFLDIGSHLMPKLEQGEEGLKLLSAMVASGHLGADSGQGFYEWTDQHWQSVLRRRREMLMSR